ncbi:MAG: dihydrofolate reductase family protein [Thermoanaerobaculia bacterium]
MDAIDTILLGRMTYGMFADYWPKVTEGDDERFAEKINSMPKVVFSRRLDRAPWGKWDDARIVSKRAEEEVAALKKQAGKDMVIWGSISVAQSLIREGLIDESSRGLSPPSGERKASLRRQASGGRLEAQERQGDGSGSRVTEIRPGNVITG